jgi:hypothetical protein
MKIKVIHQWRDWLLESAGGGQYSFINKDNKAVVRTIVAKSDIDAENQCHGIIKSSKNMENIGSSGSVEA